MRRVMVLIAAQHRTRCEAAESVAFGIDGKFYEIDLSQKHAAALRDAYAPFIGSARRAATATVVARQEASTRSGRRREGDRGDP
jgi:nucleoid-associated protein Lsr2